MTQENWEEFNRKNKTMNNYLEKVKEFHHVFKSPVLETPTIIKESRFKLRYDLIFEELEELRQSYEDQNKVEILDALSDLVYVTMGAILELGYKNVFDEAFERVHQSNMSKACKTIEEANDTIQWYKEYRDTDSYMEKQDDESYLIFRTTDNKNLKNINYKAVELIDLAI